MRSLTKSLLQLNVAILCSVAAFNLSAALIIVEPSNNSYKDIQEALIIAEPGDVVRLTGGTFIIEDGLSLDVPGVKIEGEGMDVSILEFSIKNLEHKEYWSPLIM